MKEMYRGAVEVENREYHRTHFNLNTRFAVLQKGELPKPHPESGRGCGGGRHGHAYTATACRGAALNREPLSSSAGSL